MSVTSLFFWVVIIVVFLFFTFTSDNTNRRLQSSISCFFLQGDTKVYPGESDSKPLDASKLVKIKFIPTRANIAVFSPVRSAEHQREQAHNEFQRAQQQAMYLQKERQPRPQMAWSTPVPIDLKSIELVFNRWDCAVRRKHPAYSGLIDSLDSLKEAVMNGVERRGETLKAHPCRCGEQVLREQSIAPFVLKPDARLPDNPTEPDTRRDRGELVDPYYIVPVIPLNDVSPKLVESVPASAPGPALVGPEMDLFSNTAVLDQLIADASNAGPIVEPASTYQQHGTAPVYAQSAGGYSYDNPAPVQDRYDRGRNGSGAAGYVGARAQQRTQQYDRRLEDRSGYSGRYSNDNYSASRGGGTQSKSRQNLPPHMLPCSYHNLPKGCVHGNSCKFKHVRS